MVKKSASVKGFWNVLKGTLLEATGRSYGWAKGPPRHKETWQRNDDIKFSGKQRLLKVWKQGNTSKEKYLGTKEKARRTVYQDNCKA